MIGVAGSVSKGWMAETLGASFDAAYYLDPLHRHEIDARCQRYLEENLADLGLFFTESNLGRRAYWRPNQVLVGGIQPNMIVGVLLVRPSSCPTSGWTRTSRRPRWPAVRPDELPVVDSLVDHPCIKRFAEQYESLKSAGDLEPIPPFFWDGSGRSAIHGSLTTAQKLFGESIFLDMVSDPERSQAIFDWVTDVSITLVRHFAKLTERTIAEVHVGECSGCMVDAESYEGLVAPTLARIARELGPVRWHSCGDSTHLLEAGADRRPDGVGRWWRHVRRACARSLRSRNARLHRTLGRRFSASTPAGLLGWVDRVLAENADGPLTVVYHLEPGYSLEHLRRLHGACLRRAGCFLKPETGRRPKQWLTSLDSLDSRWMASVV